MKKNYFYSDPATEKVCVERRSGVDRRSRGIILSLCGIKHRRRKTKGRRQTDRGGYVDIYDFRTWGIALSILALSLMDATLTGLHLLKGSARELNPIMNAVLNYGGIPAFFGVKAIMTILPVAIIMLHKEWALGRYAARLCLWSYIILSLYHIYLIFGVQKLTWVLCRIA
jgi:hypothetical protein